MSSIATSTRWRITAGLFLSQSFFSAAMIASFTLMPIIAAQLTGNDSAAGVPNTVTLLGRALFAYPVGWLMDRAGRRIGLSLGYLFGVLGAALSVWGVIEGSFIAFCLGAGLAGMGRGASDQARYIAAEIYPLERRARIMGLIVFASTAGAVGGPLLVDVSGRWVRAYGLVATAGPYVAAAALMALALALTVALLRPDPLHIGRALADSQPHQLDARAGRPLSRIFADGAVRLAVVAMVVSQLVMTLIMVITPLHMNHQGHGAQLISLVIMAHTLGMFGLSSVTGWLIDRFGRVAMIILGAAVLIVASLLTPTVTAVPWLAAALFLLGLGWNFCFIAGSSLLSGALGAQERGRTQGASEVLVALASGAGSLGTGAIFQHGGIVMVSAVGLAFALLLVAVMAWGARRPSLTAVESS
jgi:MFS family permease